jgi:Fic family protein
MPNLKDLCKAKDLTLTDLSNMSGLSLPMLSKISTGEGNPRKATLEKISKALRLDMETLESVITSSTKIRSPYSSWNFMRGLDPDLKKGLLEQLICVWTHNSTGLEGNTISEGDTHLILTEGLTVSGKSLREHQEVHGHGSAIKLISSWISEGIPLTTQRCHELQRLIQTETVFDIYSPVGKWKTESNGTRALKSNGESFWHEYASPGNIPFLMEKWLPKFKVSASNIQDEVSAIKTYTLCHLGFVDIHPYADGNGRMARLLASVPLLKSGYPPVIIQKESRREYLGLLGNYSSVNPSPTRENYELIDGAELDALIDFFTWQWEDTRKVVKEFRSRQEQRLVRDQQS